MRIFSILVFLVSFLTTTWGSAETGHEKMVRLLQTIADRVPSENNYFNEGIVLDLETEIDRLPSTEVSPENVSLLSRLGKHLLYLGRERDAIGQFIEAKSMAVSLGLDTEILNALRFELGVAYLRLGETENCCALNNPDACILPIQGEGIHSKKEGSEAASREFLELLQSGEVQQEIERKTIWLFNLAHMTLGTYPTEVPAAFRIPPEVFQSEEAFPRFLNIAPAVGLDTFSQLGGAVFDDFNGDEWLDLMVSSWHPGDALRVFINQGNGQFKELGDESGLAGITGGCNLIQGDYDNDGDLDVYVTRGGWFFDYGKHPNSLLRNDGHGRFKDVTFEAGLGDSLFPSQTAAFTDFDLDGDLDLYVGNESSPGVDAPCQLFENNGDGTFVDIAGQAGVENNALTKGVVWGDYDGDRYPDLFVSNYGGLNRLYRNNGDGTFWDEAIEEGVYEPEESFAAWFWDYDNDGFLDLFVTDYSGKVETVAAHFLGVTDGSTRDRLYRGMPGGGFEEVSLAVGLNRPTFAMGANFGDLNNDGFLDMYLGTGWPDYFQLMPNVMFLNKSGAGFSDVTTAGGFGNLQKGHGVAFADFDNDGDEDVFIQMGGALQGDKYFDLLHENPGFGNQWIGLRLRGTESNASAIGARIRAVVSEDGKTRSIYRQVGSGGSFGANPLRQTIGLGAAEQLVRLEVYWPVTEKTQVFNHLETNRFYALVEGKEELKPILHAYR